MSERVEMTISKGVLRIGGTAIGGTIGYLVMLNSRLATDPYLLMVRFQYQGKTSTSSDCLVQELTQV